MRSRIDGARIIGRTLAHYHITAAIGAGGGRVIPWQSAQGQLW